MYILLFLPLSNVTGWAVEHWQKKRTCIVPDYCVLRRPSGEAVYLIKDKCGHEQILTAGECQDGVVEIFAGLQEGDIVAVSMVFGAGSETIGPMAVEVIGGMISSTALTLVVVPSVYSLIEHGLERWSAFRLRWKAKQIDPEKG